MSRTERSRREKPVLDPEQAREYALKRLGVREYSAGEMISALRRKGSSPELASETVERLVRAGLIDDTRYLRVHVRHHLARGKGPLYILNKLKQKGVRAGLDQIRAVADELGGVSEVDSAREIVERRYPGWQQDRAIAAKAYQALLRRGFSHEVAREAVMAGRRRL